MCHPILQDARLWRFLLQIDGDLANDVREKRCPLCGAALHRANYPRKPRGGPQDLAPEYSSRFSYCCSKDGCRRRATPPSVRFLGRKVYLKVLVVLVTAMRQGPTPPGAILLEELLGTSRRTLARWAAWWKEIFPRTTFWKTARSLFVPPLDDHQLPSSLLAHFGRGAALEKFLDLLRFLSPITASRGLQLRTP